MKSWESERSEEDPHGSEELRELDRHRKSIVEEEEEEKRSRFFRLKCPRQASKCPFEKTHRR